MNNTEDETPPLAVPPCSGVFSECRESCPFHRLANNTGRTEHDCAHPSNSPNLPTDETPCESLVCPIFWSNDPEGDADNSRYEHEVEGHWHLQNDKGQKRP